MTGERILVVDDNDLNVKLVSYVLSAAGFDIRSAGDCAEAEAVLAEFRPHLLLLDLALPGMNGLDFARKLKTDPQLRDLPIVLLTASAMKGDDQRAKDAGCDGYITKPIDTRTFARVVSDHLRPTDGP